MYAPRFLLTALASIASAAGAQQIDSSEVLESDAVEVTVGDFDIEAPPPASVVEPEYQRWSSANARALVAYIASVGVHGLDPAEYHPEDIEAALAGGEGPDLDRVASTSFTWLVEDMRDGRTPMTARKQWFVVDPDPDLLPTTNVMADALLTGDVAGAIDALQPKTPDYAVLKDALAATLPEEDAKRSAIRANMDRWRWLPRDLGGQYLLTNVPEYQLRLTVNDKIISTYRTIVGSPKTPTPQLAETVEGVIFNPTWTVPQSIVKGEGLGAKALANPAWARSKGYKVVQGEGGWIGVVQQPGPTNSLGVVKLDMPNPHAIFLHDTPNKSLFDTENRAYSHGCIRTERALELGMTIAILGRGATKEEAVAVSTSGEYTRVPVQRTMPVYITYFTMGRDIEGKLRSFPDIYGRDAPVLASLDEPRVRNRARVTSEEVIAIEAPGA